MDTLRCIHVSRLLLDQQLQVAGDFEPAVRKIVEDATLIAFDRVIDEALEREVDCLLISGDCFEPADQGLRGPAALARGIARLAEHDTAVIIHSDARLWSNWPAGLRLAPNAHRLGGGIETSVPIMRHGKLLATISAGTLENGHAAWQIHLGHNAESGRTILVDQDIGPMQGMNAGETGPHGCRLAEIDSAGAVHQTLVPVAPVRWESVAAVASPEMTRDDLLQELASQLELRTRSAGERVRIVTWTISGHGPLFDCLSQPAFRQELLDDLTSLEPIPGVAILAHALKLHPSNGLSMTVATAGDLAGDFSMRLAERLAHPNTAVEDCLLHSSLHGGPWEVTIESLLGELDAGELAHDTQRLTMHWFAAPEELSS